MSKSQKPTYGGKQAAPFVKGGGRDAQHPNTAKGGPRKTGKK